MSLSTSKMRCEICATFKGMTIPVFHDQSFTRMKDHADLHRLQLAYLEFGGPTLTDIFERCFPATIFDAESLQDKLGSSIDEQNSFEVAKVKSTENLKRASIRRHCHVKRHYVNMEQNECKLMVKFTKLKSRNPDCTLFGSKLKRVGQHENPYFPNYIHHTTMHWNEQLYSSSHNQVEQVSYPVITKRQRVFGYLHESQEQVQNDALCMEKKYLGENGNSWKNEISNVFRRKDRRKVEKTAQRRNGRFMTRHGSFDIIYKCLVCPFSTKYEGLMKSHVGAFHSQSFERVDRSEGENFGY